MSKIEPHPKRELKYNKQFVEWIRCQPCEICKGWDSWSVELGVGRNTPSHVIVKGSGGDEGNLLPMCLKCHRRFEDSPSMERRSWLPVAERYWRVYRGEWVPKPTAPQGASSKIGRGKYAG